MFYVVEWNDANGCRAQTFRSLRRAVNAAQQLATLLTGIGRMDVVIRAHDGRRYDYRGCLLAEQSV